MSKQIRGKSLENLKKLTEGRSSSLDPRPEWSIDPRSITDLIKDDEEYDCISYMEHHLEEVSDRYDILDYLNRR